MKQVDWKHKGDACPCPSCKIRRGEEPAPPPVKVSIRTDGRVMALEAADSEKKRVSEDSEPITLARILKGIDPELIKEMHGSIAFESSVRDSLGNAKTGHNHVHHRTLEPFGANLVFDESCKGCTDPDGDSRKEHQLLSDIMGCSKRLAFLEEQLEALRKRRK